MSKHEKIEKNIGLMGVLIAVVIGFAGVIEIAPLMTQASVVEPVEGLEPRNALELAGQNIYVSEGCYNCHSQQVRPFVDETLRYGHYSVAGESVYDRPFQWGSKRTGPDLARVGGRYSNEWHEIHLIDPRAVVPTSNMPGYPWLAETEIDVEETVASMKVLQMLGHPYSDEQIANAATSIEGKTQLDALVAYLQDLGTAMPKRYQ
ncbi:cytochrome-c oxidase, cbb3-type subunit II [Marinicella sp. S1101]|uniref:cytochrome-c oxidase, cbb3-type subunit II n=1 Tax=Marinicella marina TaxID=2996016 RepID=UPI002260A212|nr:cytochrome-c oxidase, cbb3-type subunit II [Marinicella marina]MCX7553320.1 cytochrome-c oxidase, cbb3-type subunit II [Marinicella marina]MDJ1139052.1 cytochrome-c oxidase, cbb3-type subunit II [Marinicella marina]